MHAEGVDIVRRNVLGGVGLLGSGALLGNWLGGSKPKAKGTQAGVTTTTATRTTNGNETPSRSGLDVETVSADVVRTSHLSVTEPVTMYVRKNGDDGNDGYSESNPEATVPAAIKAAPLSDRTEFLRIRVQNQRGLNERRSIIALLRRGRGRRHPRPPARVGASRFERRTRTTVGGCIRRRIEASWQVRGRLRR